MINFKCHFLPSQRLDVTIQDLNKLLLNASKFSKDLDDINTVEKIKNEYLNNAISVKSDELVSRFKNNNVTKAELELFTSLLNDFFVSKKIIVSKDTGFSIADNSNYDIPLKKLSSGEKNLIIIMFDCIFETVENQLILIDEPEISLHVAWQLRFLDAISQIQSLKKNKFLIATHSPQIIHNRKDLCIRLSLDD
jgi:predicted ATP-dependent endonuclease of OLD family